VTTYGIETVTFMDYSITAAISQWRYGHRLSACVRARGAHSEHIVNVKGKGKCIYIARFL